MDDKILRVWIKKHSVECWMCLLVGYVTTMYVYIQSVPVENWLDGMSIGLGDDHSWNVSLYLLIRDFEKFQNGCKGFNIWFNFLLW